MNDNTYDLGLWRILRRIDPEFLSNVTEFYLFGIIGGSLLLFKENRLYGYGFNGNGRLGVGHFCPNVFGKPEEIIPLRNKRIHSVAGADFIVSLVEDGELLAWGANIHGQLGLGDFQDRAKPVKVMSNIKKVECSQAHVMALDRKHRCWCWGRNQYGQAGWYIDTDSYAIPTCIILDEDPIIDIACCESASLALTQANRLHIWGKIDHHTLQHTFIELDELQIQVKQIIGLSKSFVCLTQDQRVCLFRPSKNDPQILGHWLPIPMLISRVFGSLTFNTCNFILVDATTGRCFIWDTIKANLTQTTITSIPDVASLYACYYTNIRGTIPEGLISNTFHLLKSFNNEFASDLCVEVHSYTRFIRKIYVNQNILREHSEYLRLMVEQQMEDDQEDTCGKKIIIRGYSYIVVYFYFRYVYTKQLHVDLFCVPELYDLANEFQDNRLIQTIPELLYDETICSSTKMN